MIDTQAITEIIATQALLVEVSERPGKDTRAASDLLFTGVADLRYKLRDDGPAPASFDELAVRIMSDYTWAFDPTDPDLTEHIVCIIDWFCRLAGADFSARDFLISIGAIPDPETGRLTCKRIPAGIDAATWREFLNPKLEPESPDLVTVIEGGREQHNRSRP